MIEFIDAFGRQTIIEILALPFNKSARFVIRRERQVIFESLSLEQLEELSNLINIAINEIEENNDKKI